MTNPAGSADDTARRGRTGVGPGKPAPAQAPFSFDRALLAAVLDPTIAIDGYGKVVLASDSVATVFGWKPEELIGSNINVLLPEPHRSLHDQYLSNYRRTGVTNILGRTRLFEVVHKDGHKLHCELSVARVDMPDGGAALFIGSFRDVTERVRAERELVLSERRFRAIFDRSYEYIGLLEKDGTVLEVNQAALDVVGAARESVVGRKFWDTPWWSISAESREKVKQAIDEAAQGKFVRFETVQRGLGDNVLVVDFSVNPVRDATGEVQLIIPEGRNITEIKRAQRSETSMLRALAALGESAAILAHEIKNPITAVNAALRAVALQLGEDQRAVLDDLVARMQRLEGMMRRTLTFTKPLELRPTEFEVSELLAQSVRALRPAIARCGADVRCEAAERGVTLRGDRGLLEEVLTNLLKNSLEALESGGSVVLSARAEQDQVVLAVDDDGPGIPDNMRASLFRPFATSKQKGTGLGLAFSRKVIEEHDGTIAVQESALGGARFEIHLPRKRR